MIFSFKELNFFSKHKAIGLIHKIYLIQLKKKYIYKASTKTKSQVKGGGRKPWRQKGTGNARAGSTRSPLWVGGGITFGPHPRKKLKKINKLEKKQTLLLLLKLKLKNCFFIKMPLILNINIIFLLLTSFSISLKNKILIIFPKFFQKKTWKTLNNLKNLAITSINTLNLSDILIANNIIFFY